MRYFVCLAALAVMFLFSTSAAAQTMMPLPAQNGTFSGMVRGYWFQAPTDFTITGLRVPTDASTAAQTIEVVKLPAPPPAYSSTTNNFTSVFRQVGVNSTAILPANILVNSGEYIGILGWRGTMNSYGQGQWSTNINGFPVTLTRMGMQADLNTTPASNLWTEVNGSISRVEMYYTVGLTVTTPSPLPQGSEQQGYSTTIQADFGQLPYNWNTSFTGLPPNLTASQVGDDLVISGTPTAGSAGTYNFTVTVTDANSDVATKPFSLYILPPAIPAPYADD
jgi:hypothetical protein